MGRSTGNMFGDLHRIPPGGQSHNTLRSMESIKSFPGNYTSMGNSTPLEAASQVNIWIFTIDIICAVDHRHIISSHIVTFLTWSY